MLAVLAVCLNYETIPIDIDRALANYAVVRAMNPHGELSYYNPAEGYFVLNGQVRRYIPELAPLHFKKAWEADHGKPWPKEWD